MSSYQARPRWFKVFAIVGVAVVLVMGVALLAGGGGHGPGRHMGGSGGHDTPSTVTGGQRPAENDHR